MDDAERLCEAAKSGDVEKVRDLIAVSDVTYFDSDGLTPLMHAAKQGHVDVLKALLEAGAPWNALTPSNLSAGDFAMDGGHQEAFETLLNAGTVPDLLPRLCSLLSLSFLRFSPFFLCICFHVYSQFHT